MSGASLPRGGWVKRYLLRGELGDITRLSYKRFAELRWWLPHFRRLASQALTPRDRWIQTGVFLFWFISSGFWRPRKPYVMRGAYGELLVRDHSEMLVILETLVDEGYDHPRLPRSIDCVLDVGCNIGAACLWFARRYPDASIVGIEADPETTAIARRNTAAFSNVRIMNAAVADHGGLATLWINRESWASSTTVPSERGLVVPAITLDDLLDQFHGRTILKLDIEGGEHAALRAATKLTSVQFITGEHHPVPGESYTTFAARLAEFRFEPPPAAVDEKRRTFVAYRYSN